MPAFSFDDLDRSEEIPGYLGAFLHGENMTAANWEVEAGASFPEHSHPHEQISIVVSGKFELTLGGKTEVLTPGRIAVIPPDTPHSGTALTKCEIIDVFSPVREDYQQ
jgi:quercetin dioxygenase-like cupin family protein